MALDSGILLTLVGVGIGCESVMESEMIRETCEVCKFWKKHYYDSKEKGLGFCCRFPPQWIFFTGVGFSSDHKECEFAQTTKSQWCGEFQAK